jgi:hypothetical protein
MADEKTPPQPDAAPAAVAPAVANPPGDSNAAKVTATSDAKTALAATPAAEPRKSLLEKAAGDAKPAEKKADEKAAEAKPDEKKPDEKAGDIEIKLPEGTTAPEKLLGEFKALGKTLGLKSDGAQKLIDLFATAEKEKQAAQQTADDKQQDVWEEEILKWPDAEEKLGLAKRAIMKLGDADAQAFFQVPFIGSNPSVVKFLASVGKLLGEAPFHETTGSAQKTFTPKDLFPKSNHV